MMAAISPAVRIMQSLGITEPKEIALRPLSCGSEMNSRFRATPLDT